MEKIIFQLKLSEEMTKKTLFSYKVL